MDEIFKLKYEEIFGDLDEKFEDILHACMVNKFGEEKLDTIDNYSALLEGFIDGVSFDFKISLEDEVHEFENDIELELEWDEFDEIDESIKAGTPWDIKDLKNKEEEPKEQLDDL